MNFRTFLATNSMIIGTVIVVVGFIWMITQDIALSVTYIPFSLTLTAFFFTLSGIIFWGIAYSLSKKNDQMKEKEAKEQGKPDVLELKPEDLQQPKPEPEQASENVDNFGEQIVQ